MDPISTIVAALVAGASAAATETASQAVKDAYAGLKELVKARFGARPAAETALEEHANDPETWDAPLRSELKKAQMEQDADVLAKAEELHRLVAESSSTAHIDARYGKGVQIGDHNTQTNQF